MKSNIRVIFLPGNGGGDTNQNFFPYLKTELEKLGIKVISPGIFPDSEIGRESIWMPYIESLNPDENTILIGHSTGAIAAMRYAQNHKILGSVLIGTYHTHMGIQSEIDAEYFDSPWDWEAIKNNQQWVVEFNAIDDQFIPIEEARHVAKMLDADYYELENGGHFYPQDTFPEVIEAIKKHI